MMQIWYNSIEKHMDVIDFAVSPIYQLLDEFSLDQNEKDKRSALKMAFDMHLARKQPTVGCADEGDFLITDPGFCADPQPPSPPAPPPVGASLLTTCCSRLAAHLACWPAGSFLLTADCADCADC